MPDPTRPPPEPAPAPDGTRETLLSGVWVAKPFVPIEAFPPDLVLTQADRRLAPRLAKPLCLCRRRVGPHVVEILLERGEDRSVDLALRIPTAPNQFKDPYILMEAEEGNSREVAVREVHFHLQGRLAEDHLAAADWTGLFSAAARKLAALRGGRRGARTRRAAARRPARRASKARPSRRTARRR